MTVSQARPSYARTVRGWEQQLTDLERAVHLVTLGRYADPQHVAGEVTRREALMGRTNALKSVYEDLMQERWVGK